MSDFKLFDNDTYGTTQNEASLIERRFEGQWIYTVALREALSIAIKRTVTYQEVFNFADKYAHEILGRQDLLFRPDESKAARYYRERAALLTAKQQREIGSIEHRIRPIDVLDQEIRELDDLLKSDSGQNRTQRDKLEELRNIHKEFEEQEVVRRDESEVLLHDWNRGIDLPTFFPQNPHNYHDFALPGERVMRVRLTHETKAENIAGVDFIYEYHRPTDKSARLAAIQYKLPQGDSKNIIINDKLQGQLDRMCAVFCDNELCVGPSYDDLPVDNRPFQLPHCCAFFRPTDRLQQFNSRLATTGYHIRRCDIDQICEYTSGRKKVITPEISMKHGISYTIFEELFTTEKLGSRWLTYEQLQKFHQKYEVIKPFEQAGIYIQEAPAPALETLF